MLVVSKGGVTVSTGPTDETIPAVFIVSGGAGALGKHVARIALSQFPGLNPAVIVYPQVSRPDELPPIMAQVAERGGVVIHTMVDPLMRQSLATCARELGVVTIDTIGDPLARLSELFGRIPVGQPGLYQRQHEVYLERIKAIEYTVDHDDGRSPQDLHQAEVILTGVSRVGKTPLSIYLSVLGWRVANVPLVKDIPPPRQLFEVDRRRVVGLTISSEVLSHHRRWRQQAFQGNAARSYYEEDELEEELAYARRIFRQGGFPTVNVTNKPIEETADQVIALISRTIEQQVAV
jgi:regulator of PEP synthase PpsR (kinase-PPPase family)